MPKRGRVERFFSFWKGGKGDWRLAENIIFNVFVYLFVDLKVEFPDNLKSQARLFIYYFFWANN